VLIGSSRPDELAGYPEMDKERRPIRTRDQPFPVSTRVPDEREKATVV
jgi:hypothetical protein